MKEARNDLRKAFSLLRSWSHEKIADLFAEIRDIFNRLCYYGIKNDNTILKIARCGTMSVANSKVMFKMR